MHSTGLVSLYTNTPFTNKPLFAEPESGEANLLRKRSANSSATAVALRQRIELVYTRNTTLAELPSRLLHFSGIILFSLVLVQRRFLIVGTIAHAPWTLEDPIFYFLFLST